MILLRTLLFGFCFLYGGSLLRAEEAPSSEKSAPPSGMTQNQIGKAEILKIRLDFEQSRYESNKLPSILSGITRLSENLAELYCLPELLKTLEYEGPPEHPFCLEYLSQLAKYHPDNPVAVCTRTGIGSDSCSSAFADQFVITNLSDLEDSSFSSLEIKLSEKENSNWKNNESAMRSAAAKLTEMEKKIKIPEENPEKQKEKEENLKKQKDKLEDLYEQNLISACRKADVVFTTTKPRNDQRTPSFKYKLEPKKEDELQRLYNQFKKSKEESAPKKATRTGAGRQTSSSRKPKEDYHPFAADDQEFFAKKPEAEAEIFPKLWRVRYLPRACYKAITNLYEFNPSSFYPACYFGGTTSPGCIKALRAVRARKNISKNPGQSKAEPSDGLVEF